MTATDIAFKPRIASIDLLRGTIMIIMALDHVRDYFHADSFVFRPLDLSHTSVALFFTRWITHFCAPGFVFLAGTSAYFISQRKSTRELSLFLLTRGLWLVFLDLLVVNFGWSFNIGFTFFAFNVLWALGGSMIAMAALLYLPKPLILVTGVVMVAGHNLLDDCHVSGQNMLAFGWALLHEPNTFKVGTKSLSVGYPLVPWLGVMALGYCCGRLYDRTFDAGHRRTLLVLLGGSMVIAFVILRYFNLYGDASHWSKQASAMFSLLSFIRTSKYPASLLFVLMTVGPLLLFLALTEEIDGWVARLVSVYGRVPLFYYLLHIYVIHLFALLAAEFTAGYDWRDWILTGPDPPWEAGFKGYGFSLAITWLIWVCLVVALYPLCKWYDSYKQTHKRQWWLSYM
jgi:uncharacterized membrane protein